MSDNLGTSQQKTVQTLDLEGKTHTVPTDELFWRPAAYGIVLQNKKVLLMKERNGYHLPGGGMDLGEMPEETAIREVKEETGLDIKNPQLIDIKTTFFTFPESYNDTNFVHAQSLLLYYSCQLAGGNLSTDGHEEFERQYGLEPTWVEIKDLNTIRVASTVDWRDIVRKCFS